MKRYFNLDCARALAILLVTLFHVWRFQNQPQSPFSPIMAYGFVGVDLFFVISGYTMMLTYRKGASSGLKSATDFWKARASRIYPTYVVAVIFWAVMVRLGVAVKSAGAYDIVMHLLMLHTFDNATFFSISGVFWSLAVEAHFYILFPLLVRAAQATRLVLCVLSLLFTFALDYLALSDGPASPVLRWNVLTFLPLFLLGMELYAHANTESTKDKLPSPYLILGAIAALKAVEALLLPAALDPNSFMLSRILIGAALGVLCIKLIPHAAPKNIFAKTVSLVGLSSYSIYLFNYIFWILQVPRIPGNPGIVITSVGVILIGILMWELLEKPFESIRHGMRARRTSANTA